MSDDKKTRDPVEPNAKTLWLLRCAADKRAQGLSWANVALTLKRQLCVWQNWLRRYPATWDRLLREAEGRTFREVGAEALTIMRCLLRSESESIRRDVGRTLTVLMFRMPRDNTSDMPSDPIFEDVSDLMELINEDHAEEDAALRPAAPTPESQDAPGSTAANSPARETGAT